MDGEAVRIAGDMTKQRRKNGRGATLRRMPLREVGILAATRTRYLKRISEFVSYLDRSGRALPESPPALDAAVAEYIEHQWTTGGSEASGAALISALARFVPEARRHLPQASFLMANWRRTVKRRRALPFAEEVVKALSGIAFMRKDFQLGMAILIGFLGLLRPAELVSLRVEDVVFPPRLPSTTILILRATKSGRRRNSSEKVLIKEPLVVAALRWLVRTSTDADKRLFPFGGQGLTGKLRNLASSLGLNPSEVSGYSLRRGGATWHFVLNGSLSKTTVHGRWADERTARIYIDGAMAQLARGALTKASEAVVAAGIQVAATTLQLAKRELHKMEGQAEQKNREKRR